MLIIHISKLLYLIMQVLPCVIISKLIESSLSCCWLYDWLCSECGSEESTVTWSWNWWGAAQEVVPRWAVHRRPLQLHGVGGAAWTGDGDEEGDSAPPSGLTIAPQVTKTTLENTAAEKGHPPATEEVPDHSNEHRWLSVLSSLWNKLTPSCSFSNASAPGISPPKSELIASKITKLRYSLFLKVYWTISLGNLLEG